MKYLLASDIHGSLPALEALLARFECEKCDMLCLLGDFLNYGPRNGVPDGLNAPAVAQRLNQLQDRIIGVRGNCDSEVDQMLLTFPVLSAYTMLVDNGRRVLLTHGHLVGTSQLPTSGYEAIFQGHTHLPSLHRREDGILVCNTGSITFPKQDNPPTYAILDAEAVTLYHLDGTPLKQLKF
ncbi:MAG: phosphodiesterase [Alloprevotella sp.]|nr:phosphodiesterase [Alloprevotella sp.]